MVCKRSLYCWKNGPCASDQTRKQIWEDNIRFRESLRDINQSDHYWSFQISKNRCLCLEGEDVLHQRPLSRKYRSASLQQLHVTDCTSITHDCNGLKFRNCFVHCPIHELNKNSEIKRADTPMPQSVVRKENALSHVKYPFYSLRKPDEEKSEYCHRYKNTLSSSRLKPSMKTKFLSQTNLTSLNENKNLTEKRLLHGSCENISKLKAKDAKQEPLLLKTKKQCSAIEKKQSSEVQSSVEKESKKTTESADCEVQTEPVKPKKRKELRPTMKCQNQDNLQELSPISRTTRKMLCENKKIPFATYGCNNNNMDIGSKRTHNVLASKLEVYPNALTAKQQKKDFIMKYIQSEKEFQRKCLPAELRKRINHSSLWALDSGKNESKHLQKKSTKYILPVVSKPLKKTNVPSNQVDYSYYRTYRKPQNPSRRYSGFLGGDIIEMESPLTSKRKITEGDTTLPKVNCTPKTRKRSGIVGEEFSLYNLHGEASPNFRAGQDVLEVGWGDSPEPLNVEPKFERNRTPLTCKKKLETKESPKSSIPFKRRNVQSTFSIPSKSIIDVAKYVAEVQELSKNIMKEFNANKRDKDLFEDDKLVSSNRLMESNMKSKSSPGHRTSAESTNELKGSNSQNKDPMFDSVLQSFINEEDDWLSQALSSQEQVKTPHKGNFVKSKSENELTLPPPVSLEKSCLTQNCRNINNNFRRTASFDLTKPHNLNSKNESEKNVNGTPSRNQCSLQEIERKRLEAKYRRERREIERRKLEALKKLEMKKLRVIKT